MLEKSRVDATSEIIKDTFGSANLVQTHILNYVSFLTNNTANIDSECLYRVFAVYDEFVELYVKSYYKWSKYQPVDKSKKPTFVINGYLNNFDRCIDLLFAIKHRAMSITHVITDAFYSDKFQDFAIFNTSKNNGHRYLMVDYLKSTNHNLFPSSFKNKRLNLHFTFDRFYFNIISGKRFSAFKKLIYDNILLVTKQCKDPDQCFLLFKFKKIIFLVIIKDVQIYCMINQYSDQLSSNLKINAVYVLKELVESPKFAFTVIALFDFHGAQLQSEPKVYQSEHMSITF
jgi:hypothetical protein